MQIVYREFPKRRFGVELEVSATCNKNIIGDILSGYESSRSGRCVKVTSGIKGWAETRKNDYWHVKYDSTCGPKGKGKDYGWEVASYIAKGSRDLNRIADAADYLREAGIETNPHCGLHVHVEAKDLKIRDMGVMLARWIKVEPLLFAICSSTRTSNSYCKSLTERWDGRQWRVYHPQLPQQFWADMAPIDHHTHNNPEKKYALNTVGWATGQFVRHYDRMTVELRLPECILDSEYISNWVKLIINFVDGCKDGKSPENLSVATNMSDALKYLNLKGDEQFFFTDKKLWDTKLWFLNKISNSSRVSDAIAEEADDLIEFISEI